MKISIKTLSRLVAVAAILMLFAMGLVIYGALRIQDSVLDSQRHLFRSQLLAEELFQSSEDLTRMARSYVATGDTAYERSYFEILDIRNGKLPRPQNYSPTYWHLFITDKSRAIAQGEAVSLRELMRREGVNEQELILLHEAQANSDKLVELEKQAFAAVKGLYDDGHGAFTIRREPDRDFAISLLYGERYVAAKATIMAPIQSFRDAIDERTKAELKITQLRQRNQIVLLMVLIALSLLGVVIVILYTRGALLLPLERLGRHAEEISRGNYASHCDIQSGNELAALGAHFNHMAKSIDLDFTIRKRAEEEVLQLNEELEIKVQERTRRLLDAQEELVRKEKLSMLGQVAGSVGHELRNPLGVMSNAVYFLQTVLSDADETTKEYLGIIGNEIVVADRIVGDLLDSVRIKPPHPDVVGVAQLIEQTLGKCTIPKSVTVKLDIPESLPLLCVDAMQIQQVLRNLINNGVEAMPEGGALEISAVSNPQSGTVRIGVKDTGVGVETKQLGKLFQPLFTTKARGIGLGLVVVKNLTQANGGSVEVESAPGVGSTFAVTLPVNDFATEGQRIAS